MTRSLRLARGASRRRKAALAAASAALLAPASASAAYTLPVTSSNIRDFQKDGVTGPAPYGLNVEAAQTGSAAIPGAKGQYAKLAIFEGHTDTRHENLVLNTNLGLDTPDPGTTRLSEHALATVSVLAGVQNNGKGIKGMLSEGNATLVAYNGGVDTWSDSLDAQVAKLAPGDVILIEAQGTQGMPLEENKDFYDSVKRASDKGVIVVLPAGNGNTNLDTAFPVRPDSGSIIVGAGHQQAQPGCGSSNDLGNSRAEYSSYGTRVNVQGPGFCVPAAANANSSTIGSGLAAYSLGFNGTSSASAMISGVTTALSSAYRASKNEALTPDGARNALVQTGSPQVPNNGESSVTKKVGPRPNLVAAVTFLNKAPTTAFKKMVTTSPGTPARPWMEYNTPATTAPYTIRKRYDCRVVRQGEPKPTWTDCGTSGYWQPATDLRAGQYVFEVRSVYGDTTTSASKINFDPTPAVSPQFTVGAGAGTASISGTTLTIDAASSTVNDNDDVFIAPGATGKFLVRNFAGVTAGAGCTRSTDLVVNCDSVGLTKVVVNTYGGNDKIDVNVPVETYLYGGAGNDTLIGRGSGKDTFAGGAGVDTVSYEHATTSRRISLDNTANDGPLSGAGTADFILADVESAVGGSGDDVIKATSDTLTGSNQYSSNPIPAGRLTGGDGNDVIQFGRNVDRVFGGNGADNISGTSADSHVDGGPGDDELLISGTWGELVGGLGSDTLTNQAFGTTMAGGSGDDWLYGGPSGTRTVYHPGAGNDVLYPSGGWDIADYDSRPDPLTFDIGALSATVEGNWSGGGFDNVVGTFDEYRGGAESDLFLSNTGSGVLKGGPAVDRVSFGSRTTGIALAPISNDGDNPRLKATETSGSSPASIELTTMEQVDGTAYADTLSAGNNVRDGWSGNTYVRGDTHYRDTETGMTLDGKGGNDTLTGGAYEDTLIGGPGIDTVNGRDGKDTLRLDDGGSGDNATCGTVSPYDVLFKDTGDTVLSGTCTSA